VKGLRSNWEASVEAAVWGAPGSEVGDEPEEVGVRRSKRRVSAVRASVVGLAEAALVLGVRPVGSGWRRRVLRRLRTLERGLGVKLCAVRKGRGGSLVSLDGLRRACPLPFAGLDRIEELQATVRELEQRLAMAEEALGSGGRAGVPPFLEGERVPRPRADEQ